MDKKAKALEIIAYAEAQRYIINPKAGYLNTIKNFMELGVCPCDTSRTHCPCPESLTEVPESGKCRCGLFWRDLDTFKRLDPSIKY